MEFFECLGVDMEISDMSFSVSLDQGRGCEWGTRNGFSSLFAQKKNLFNPYFWQMIREIIRFKQDVISYLEALDNNPDIDRSETLGDFIKSHGYSELFQKAYLIPICASIWTCPLAGVLGFSAYHILSFCHDHNLLQLFGRPQWLTVRWRSHTYVNKVKEELQKRGCQIRTGCEVNSVTTNEEGCTVACTDGSKEVYDRCIMAAHAPDTLRMLGEEATFDEIRILGAFQYVYCDIFLHCDKTLLPRNPAAWSSWNFLGTMNSRVCVTYWLNILQNLGETERPYCVTLNPPHTPEHTLLKWTTGHPVPSVAASKASSELYQIQGKRGIWFCGAYQGYGFHEDGLKAGVVAADGMLRRNCSILDNPKHMVPTWPETGARIIVTRFLKSFIQTGCIILLEEGGTIFTFQGTDKKCSLKVSLRVHSTQFYWKVATEADIGLADAFIHGDFSFVDKHEGLLNFFMIYVANRDLKASVKTFSKKRVMNTSHSLDETMTYSCAIFKSEDEDLKDAQLRKISLLIRKAKISKEHHILEIGFGWGSLAVEVVKQTGCKYTGITLSEQQLEYAQLKVEQAGLQTGFYRKPTSVPSQVSGKVCVHTTLLIPHWWDFTSEMLEHVGHDFIGEFFSCCETALAEDGLLVLQFISIPDQRYGDHRHSTDFLREYIFPGGSFHALSQVTSAMTAASRLWTWEYYFDYCAAGFKTCTIGDYQIVFSRPGNVATFGDPYNVTVPSAY
ncbi:hypothetical protein KY290_038516 [Solanum tuberosum]|uniref:Amine oxidase domain-containing protein n=1 Tax=Solanum tuberosum TaxID=4113 RepID=A0ABQ7TYL2_SOLTU|nr:hypothetical protein KY290_038516 [Solanum tuberosum]